MKPDLFQPCDHCWVFQICWHIECSTFTASYFRIWNSSTGIPSPPLALFIVMLPKAHLTSHSRMSGSRWVITPSWFSGSWRSFLYSSSVYSCHHAEVSWLWWTAQKRGREELPHVQGKRSPRKTIGVARGQQRADRLKPQSQKTSQSDHRATALSNSMTLSHAVWGHPRWTGHGGEVWQHVVRWRREWKTTSVFLPWDPHEQHEKANR